MQGKVSSNSLEAMYHIQVKRYKSEEIVSSVESNYVEKGGIEEYNRGKGRVSKAVRGMISIQKKSRPKTLRGKMNVQKMNK